MHQTQTCIFRSIHNYHFIVDTSINDIISLWFITWSSWDFHILIVEHHIRSFMTSCHRARKWCLPGKPVVSNMKLSCQENILNVFEQTITKSFLHSFFQFCWCFKCSMVVFNSFQTRNKKQKNRRLFRGAKRSSCLRIIWRTHHSEVRPAEPSQWHPRNQFVDKSYWGNSTWIPCFQYPNKKIPWEMKWFRQKFKKPIIFTLIHWSKLLEKYPPILSQPPKRCWFSMILPLL